MKWHINKNGIPAQCKAMKGNCPLGGSDLHFDTSEEANEHVKFIYQEKYGVLPDNNPAHQIETSVRLDRLVEFAGTDSVMNELYHSLNDEELLEVVAEFEKNHDVGDKIKSIDEPYEKFEALVDDYGIEILEQMSKKISVRALHAHIDKIEKNLNMEEYYLEFDEKEFEQITNPTVEDRVLNLRGNMGTKNFLDRIANTMDSDYIDDFNNSIIRDYGIEDYIDEDDTPEEKFEAIIRFLGDSSVAEEITKWLPKQILESKIQALEYFEVK